MGKHQTERWAVGAQLIRGEDDDIWENMKRTISEEEKSAGQIIKAALRVYFELPRKDTDPIYQLVADMEFLKEKIALLPIDIQRMIGSVPRTGGIISKPATSTKELAKQEDLAKRNQNMKDNKW